MVRPTRYYSNKQEKEVAKIVDGHRSSNSGAAKFSAGDVYTRDFLYECKTTTKSVKSYSIKKEVLEKLKKESFELGKLFSVLVFNFGPDEELYYVLNQRQFLKLLNAYTEIEQN